MNRRSQAVFLLLALVTALAAPARAATYHIRWYLGHKNLDYFEEAARDFKKVVETGSKGDIDVTIVLKANDDPQGPDHVSKIAAEVASGKIEMGHSFLDVMGDPRLHAFEAPYLMRNYRHVEGVIEGPVGANLLAGLQPQGLKGLSFTFSGGANGIATVDRPLRTPEDLKGLKIGCYGDSVDQAWLKSLGAIPVPIGRHLGSIASMARRGQLDGVIITWRNFERESLDTAFNYFNLPNSSYLLTVTYINKKYFESMPKAYRDLISKASIEAARVERARTIELNEDARREEVSKGVRAVYLTDANRRRFVAALKPVYKNVIDGVLGRALIQKIENTKDAPENPLIPEALARSTQLAKALKASE